MTNMPLLETCGNVGNGNEKPSIMKSMKSFPYGEVSIDEKLFPSTSRRGFIQCMPNKPTKFGIKFWMLCYVKTSYVLRATPYVGKEDRPQVGVAEHVVMSLMEPYHKTGQNVTTDNYITSLTTAENLLLQNITMAGTLRKNKRERPLNLHVDTRQQSLYSSRFLFSQKDGIMIPYITKLSKKKIYSALILGHYSSCRRQRLQEEARSDLSL